jgi:hypothetical protein
MTAKQRWRKGGRRFIQLWSNVKRSQAYYGLSVYARSALIELLDRYTGCNNGMIGLGCRELATALDCSRDRAAKALRELDDSGLATPLTGGVWRGKKATEWRLSFYRCDKTGELPTHNWPARSQSVCEDAKDRVTGHKPSPSPSDRTQTLKTTIRANAHSPSGATHIDIYQGNTEFVTASEEATEQPCDRPKTQASNYFGRFDDPGRSCSGPDFHKINKAPSS